MNLFQPGMGTLYLPHPISSPSHPLSLFLPPPNSSGRSNPLMRVPSARDCTCYCYRGTGIHSPNPVKFFFVCCFQFFMGLTLTRYFKKFSHLVACALFLVFYARQPSPVAGQITVRNCSVQQCSPTFLPSQEC